MSKEEEAILDLEALKEYLMVESKDEIKAFLEELVPVFTTDANATFEKIKAVVQNGDIEAIRAEAHSLKSCARNLALKRLACTCQTLESAAINNEPFDSAETISAIEKHKDEAIKALTELVS